MKGVASHNLRWKLIVPGDCEVSIVLDEFTLSLNSSEEAVLLLRGVKLGVPEVSPLKLNLYTTITVITKPSKPLF